MRSRYGFTLVEAVIVMVLLALLVLIGFPKMSSAMVRSELRSARTTMINLVATARAAAVQRNQLTSINIAGNTAHVQAGADIVGTVHDLSAEYGVTVTVSGGTTIEFDPRGFGAGFGTADTIRLSRGGYTSTITIDGLGRVLK